MFKKSRKSHGSFEPLVQNQFITPFTILKLMNCVVIPVWTYLSHIWANATAFRTSSLWYKILSKSSKPNTSTSSPKRNTYVVNFQSILRFNYHKLYLPIKTVLTLTSVQEPYQTPIAKYRGHYNPASEDSQVSHRVKNTQNESVNTIEWKYGIAD